MTTRAFRRPHCSSLAALLLGVLVHSPAICADTTEPVRRDVEVLLVQGKAEEALPGVERLVELTPGDVPLQELRGRIWAQAGRLPELHARLTQRASEHPRDPKPEVLLAQLPACPRGQRLQHLDAALQRDPGHAPALFARWQLADQEPELAASLRERMVEPLAQLAVAIHALLAKPPADDSRRSSLRDSLVERSRVLETRNPGDPRATFLRAQLLLAEGHRPQAQRAIELGRYLAPADPWGYYLQARLYLNQHQSDKGLSVLEKALRVTPRTPTLLQLEVRARLQQQRSSEALALLAQVAEELRPQAPGLIDELHATVAWARRDRPALASVLARRKAEHAGRSAHTWRRFEGYLAYLDGELAGVHEATLNLPGHAQGELPRLRRALEDQTQRRASGDVFVTVLALVLLALVAMGGHMGLRNRRSQREATP